MKIKKDPQAMNMIKKIEYEGRLIYVLELKYNKFDDDLEYLIIDEC